MVDQLLGRGGSDRTGGRSAEAQRGQVGEEHAITLPDMPRPPRLAAGRARALGLPTRGTTNPNRLRRMDNWITARLGAGLRDAADPLVIDLGYGATPVTAIELATRPEEKRAALSGLGAIPGKEALELARTNLANADLKEEAAAAVETIAWKLRDSDKEAAVNALKEAQAATQNEPLKAKIADELKQLGA